MLYRWLCIAALALLTIGCDRPVGIEVETPLGVVLLIGDGMGEGALDAARLRRGSLAMESLRVRGWSLTASASHEITDSGAAATALATGVLTYNGAIGVGPDGEPRETVLDAAEARGMATGLVATSSVTHATPAAFAAHQTARSMEMEIATEISGSGVDVLLGAGHLFFLPDDRPDGADLLAPFRARGCEVTVAYDTFPEGQADCVVGLFARRQLPPAEDRQPTLPEMATLAIEVLADDPDGFFLMVEGSQIDWAGHANDGPRLTAETLEFDAAVEAVLGALESRPNTLIIVTADHETGGLSVGPESTAGDIRYEWSTTRHTAGPAPVFAGGVGAERFAGTYPINRIGQLLLQMVREQ